jgi:hypothetical protein
MGNDISSAKAELFGKLSTYKEVVGASIRNNSGNKYIVILLSRLTDRIKPRIPKDYKGNKVIHEVVGEVSAL